MDISKVTEEDGRMCAVLLKALGVARFDGVTGRDLEAFVATKRWVGELAKKMAENLKPGVTVQKPPPSEGFKVKSLGPIPGSSTPQKKKRKK